MKASRAVKTPDGEREHAMHGGNASRVSSQRDALAC